MTRHRTLIRLSAALVGVALVWACGGDSPTAPPTLEPARPATVTVSPATADLTALGATVQLTAEVRDQNGRVLVGATVTWRSSDTRVATVDASGLVTGVAVGVATITASADNGQWGTAKVTVRDLERAVLVALYNATDGPNWVNNDNWLRYVPLGDWYGVDTDTSGRVVTLDLSRNGLAGQLPVRERLLPGFLQRDQGEGAEPELGSSAPDREADDGRVANSHVKGRSWDCLASQDLSSSVSQGTIWRYVAVDRRLGYAQLSA